MHGGKAKPGSAISLAAVAHANYFDQCFLPAFKEKTIVSASRAESRLRRLELLHIAVSGGKIAIRAVQDIQRGLPVDTAQIGSGFVRPQDGKARGIPRSQAELAEDILMRNAFASRERCAGTLKSGGCFSTEGFFLNRRICERLRERLDHDFEQVMHGGNLFVREHVEQQVRVSTLLGEIGFHKITRPPISFYSSTDWTIPGFEERTYVEGFP